MKAKKVKVLRASNPNEMEKQMNDLLTKGYELSDILTTDADSHLYTVMTKND